MKQNKTTEHPNEWKGWHVIAEYNATLAERAIRDAHAYYSHAAKVEEKALLAVPINKPRMRAITAVSAASLYAKAQCFDDARRVAGTWMKRKGMPKWAVKQLWEIVSS